MAIGPINSVLIANRGEIAARIVRSCKRLGIRSIAVYSEADEGSLYTQAADEAYPLGGVSAAESYLLGEKLLAIARRAGADALHPGYGFLSENPSFAEDVERAGLRFIGPSPETMRLLGHKHSARLLASQLGIPLAAGYDGAAQDAETLTTEALSLGFPLLVKAAAGGGGKGMRRIDSAEQISSALSSARREAESFFADGRLILERIFAPARHIEVQLLADTHGNIIHLFERDCSMQRSYQKLIEEAPARDLSDQLREQLYAAALTIGSAVKLRGAATVEFLVATHPQTAALPFIFLEVNPRLQVEHPVTEMITGVDIVEQQIRIAAGERLGLNQTAISRCGHAIEVRICAENPIRGFLPTGGRITDLQTPDTTPTLRLEHSLNRGTKITSHSDSMLAKLIAGGPSFDEARQRLLAGLSSFQLGGVDTNVAFLATLLESTGFRATPPSTGTLAEHPELSMAACSPQEIAALLGYFSFALPRLAHTPAPHSPFYRFADWRAGMPTTEPGQQTIRWSSLPVRRFRFHCATAELERIYSLRLISISSGNPGGPLFRFEIEGVEHSLGVSSRQDNARIISTLALDGVAIATTAHRCLTDGELFYRGHRIVISEQFPLNVANAVGDNELLQIRSPLPGKLLEMRVELEEEVTLGQTVAILESMKMEHSLTAPSAGTIVKLHATAGEVVQSGDLIAVIRPAMICP